MTYPGLKQDSNLSDLTDTRAAWSNLAQNISYSYSALRANYVNNSSVIRQDEKSNVVVSFASGIATPLGDYAYKITEQVGTPIPFPFTYLRAATTSISYSNPEWRLNVENGPVVGSILLKAGSHAFVGMALRPALGGTFFKTTNYPFLGINLLTGEVVDSFSNKKPYEIMGASSEGNGWWRVSMSSICQQAYAAAAIDLIFLQNGNLNVVPNASSSHGSKFIYAALPQIEPGHEPSPITITFGEQPTVSSVIASSASGLSLSGNDISAINGLSEVGIVNILQVASLKSHAQSRLTALTSSGQQIVASGQTLLPSSSPSSSGTYFVNSISASGYSINGNPLNSVSGSPFSGSTATVPIVVQSLIPNKFTTNSSLASGSLSTPTLAIPIDYNGFYVMLVAGKV